MPSIVAVCACARVAATPRNRSEEGSRTPPFAGSARRAGASKARRRPCVPDAARCARVNAAHGPLCVRLAPRSQAPAPVCGSRRRTSARRAAAAPSARARRLAAVALGPERSSPACKGRLRCSPSRGGEHRRRLLRGPAAAPAAAAESAAATGAAATAAAPPPSVSPPSPTPTTSPRSPATRRPAAAECRRTRATRRPTAASAAARWRSRRGGDPQRPPVSRRRRRRAEGGAARRDAAGRRDDAAGRLHEGGPRDGAARVGRLRAAVDRPERQRAAGRW